MAEELRIIRRYHEGRAIHDRAQFLHLFDASVEKMLGMPGNSAQCRVAVVDLLLSGITGDPMIFNSGEASMIRVRQCKSGPWPLWRSVAPRQSNRWQRC